jgi:hypothetical protein
LHLVSEFPETHIYSPFPCDPGIVLGTFGESIVRSAAAVEQTGGGLMTRLWDDPFEWTLPEHLSSSARITEYIEEVEQVRKKAFELLKDDKELSLRIPAPAELRSINEILTDTLVSSTQNYERAVMFFRAFKESD